MPFSVEHLIEGRPAPVTIAQEEPITKALSVMIEYDYSQLPVIDTEDRPLGMITYEGIFRGMRNFQAKIEDLHVRDAVVAAPLSNLEDDLFDLLAKLKPANVVLVVDSERKLAGIVTSYDTTEYFRGRAEHLMRVEDIETMIKDFIVLAYTHEDGQLDESALNSVISNVTKNQTNSKEKNFDELDLGQYINVLTYGAKWSFFEPIFNKSREPVRKLLDQVRFTRNDLAHFRNEITADQADQLRFCSDWLARCWDETNIPSSNIKQESETVSEHTIDDQSSGQNQAISIIAEESAPRESRYAPLANWLQSQPGSTDQVRFSFEQIEKIIDGELPPSAYTHRAWWANESHSHQQSRLWLEVGWRRTYLNMTKKEVTFVRIREREKAYIEFFSKLLVELRKKPNFPMRDVSPDGASWIVVQVINEPRSTAGQFIFSFSRDSRLRVELYLDTANKTTTKQIFDHIHNQKENLETTLAEISWERIDDKRASRIAIYHPGSILDDQKTLKALQVWAAETMDAFYQVIEPLASQAAQEVLSQ